MGVLKMDAARKKVMELSEKYKFKIDPDAYISDITVGMQQRVEILKMLYCDNDILIFDEPTAVLTPQEISELMKVMKQLIAEGKSIIFITHKLNEIKDPDSKNIGFLLIIREILLCDASHIFALNGFTPVSYTHLDVYKRQRLGCYQFSYHTQR